MKRTSPVAANLQVLSVVCQWISELQAQLRSGSDAAVQVHGSAVVAAAGCSFFLTSSGAPADTADLSGLISMCRCVHTSAHSDSHDRMKSEPSSSQSVVADMGASPDHHLAVSTDEANDMKHHCTIRQQQRRPLSG